MKTSTDPEKYSSEERGSLDIVSSTRAGERGSVNMVTSVNVALNHIGMGRAHWLLLGYTSFAWAADACETMILSFLGPSAVCAWPDQVGPVQESVLTSVVFAGMMVGVYALGAVSDWVGRKRGFLVSALLLGASGVASAVAPSFVWLVVFRMLVGAALGGTPIAITLFAEWVPSARRGSLVLLMQSAWTVGTVLEAALAWAVLSSLGWRWLLGLSAVPLFVLVLGYPWLPESAYWLVAKHRYEEAEAVVHSVATCNSADEGLVLKFRPEEGDHDRAMDSMETRHPKDDIATVVEGVDASHDQEKGSHKHGLVHAMKTTFQHVFSKRLALTTSILWLVWFANATTYYGLVLLTTSLQATSKDETKRCTENGEADFSTSDYTAVFVTSLAEAPGLLVAALLIDTKGRLWCLRSGLVLCSICILLLLLPGGNTLQLVLLFISRAAIEGTFSVLYVYTPELYPTKVRSFGLALCNGFSRLGGLTAPFVTVYLVENSETMWSVIALGSLCIVAAIGTMILPIETMGADLQGADQEEDEHVEDGESIPLVRNGPTSSSAHVDAHHE